MKKILITGGAGFIGRRLSLTLSNFGFDITVLDCLSSQIHGHKITEASNPIITLKESGVKFIRGSVTNKSDWELAIKDQDAIIHLAAETGTGQSMYEIQKYVDVNINGTSLMLDVLANTNHKVKKMIVASSRAIYGEGKYQCEVHGTVYPTERLNENLKGGLFECLCPICSGPLRLMSTDENSKIHPTSIYGITKQTQEQLVLTAGKSLGIPAVAFRYQNVYGPGQSLSNPYTGILSIFSTQIRNNNSIIIFEDGKESRDFVYIDDVVDATVLGLLEEKANYEVFNVGANEPIQVITVAEQLKKNYNSNVQIKVTGNYRLGDIRHNYADLTKISKLLGYKPKVSFSEGIRLFCDWVEGQEIAQDNYESSIRELKQKGLFK